MTVYIEYVILDNFVIDYLLLSAALYTLRIRRKKRRLIPAALCGTAFAALLPLFSIGAAAMLAVKLAVGLAMVLIAANYGKAKRAAAAYAVFLLFTFASGGAITGIMYMLKKDISLDSVITYSSDIPVSAIIVGCAALIWCAKRVIAKIYKKRDVYPFVRKAVIKKGDKVVETSGFIDSGNRLFDAVTGLPIVVISKALAVKLVDFTEKTDARYINLSTVGGKSRMLIFSIDYLQIYNGDEPHIIVNVMAGISPSPFKDGESYEMLLNPSII